MVVVEEETTQLAVKTNSVFNVYVNLFETTKTMSSRIPSRGTMRPTPRANTGTGPTLNFNATINNRGVTANGSVSGVPVFGPIKGNGSVTINKQWGQPARITTSRGVGL